ncbi:universal stress protein [Halomarina pelagica]|uniref:universal stress protein n=1 Tax=Halomarina pelagica TaxID=2961599 RepID=UPI0020C38C20|nr:universal stress protein [Halomarina sp. BND7]
MFDRILLPVDGSDPAKRAAAAGLELAETYDAAVDVLCAIEPSRMREEEAARRHREERGAEIVAEVVGMAEGSGVPVETHLVEGRPHRVVVDHVNERGIDLVAMGRRGRTGLGERLLGSVTEPVLRGSDAPVLTVGGDADAGGYENVLVPTDGSGIAERAAPYGADLARRYGATLHLLNVVDVQREGGLFNAGGVDAAFVERLEERGREKVDRLAERVRETDPDAEPRTAVVRGAPHVGILEYADANDVDLVVMSSEGESNLAWQLLGSVADRVLRTVEVPVLIVPSG